MYWPDHLQKYKEKAFQAVLNGWIGEVIFSQKTYQIEILDPKEEESLWLFLQFGRDGNLADYFCHCDTAEHERGCIHLASALYYIYQDYELPLHERFKNSFWSIFTRQMAENYGYSFEEVKANFSKHFSIHTDNQDILDILNQDESVSEENSIKLSNLDPKELKRWREGRPSANLLYELSFWADLGRYFFMKEEKEKVATLYFDEIKQKLPSGCRLEREDFLLKAPLQEVYLEQLIPYLDGLKSSLQTLSFPNEELLSVDYNTDLKTLFIESKQLDNKNTLENSNSDQGIEIGEYIYSYQEGFYSNRSHPLIEKKEIQESEISFFLDEYHTLIKKFLNTALESKKTPVKYDLFFDEEWNLHIEPYLFEKKDLQKKESHLFKHWVYLQEEGFFAIKELYFTEKKQLINKEDLSSFIEENRSFFLMQQGFSLNTDLVKEYLTYHLDEKGALSFESRFKEFSTEWKSFENFVYIKDRGFFTRKEKGIFLEEPYTIEKDEVADFIRMHKKELEELPSFFSSIPVIESAFLEMDVQDSEKIIITPRYISTHLKNYTLYPPFVYVDQEGFSALKEEVILPERFEKEVVLKGRELEEFLAYELDLIRPYFPEEHPQFEIEKDLVLEIESIEKQERDYRLKLSYQSKNGGLSLVECWKKKEVDQRFIFSNTVLFDLTHTIFDFLEGVLEEDIDFEKEEITLSTTALLKLLLTYSIETKDPKIDQVIDELSRFQVSELPDLTYLKSSLRSYQKTGVQWLWFLHQHKLSGLLCDDMGLGKTHQTMALIAALLKEKEHQFKSLKVLIVCPTSVIYHWQEKLEAFLDIKVHTYYGQKRHLNVDIDESLVILTSYAIARLDAIKLSSVIFDLAVFDEIQAAKNHRSRLYKALYLIPATMRLGLTGTPIENRLRELKALFDLVLRHYMPSEVEYLERFVKPIEQEGSSQQILELSRMIKPFILRRKKQDVLLDLPEKIEEVIHCELLPSQKALYDDLLLSSRSKLVHELRDETSPVPYLHVFALLSALKQVCNHPAAYLKEPAHYLEYESGKWELFLELLKEALGSGQKVVVFSQYLSMLDIMEIHLKQMNISYATVRGSTRNRGEQIKRFNTDQECMVFLGSLQAVGSGVDLTAASVVIHYDRWWNAAREMQATDRVHRIGQERGVQVFKLVTKNSFEERIDQMIQQKGMLLEEVVGVDDQYTIKAFSREELIQLLY